MSLLDRVIRTNNGMVWTSTGGRNGASVLLISGGPGCCNYLDEVAALIEDSCRVIVFDPIGCGRSTYEGEGYNIYEYLADLEEIRKAYHLEKWIVVGHSFGADLGLAYTLTYPNSVSRYVSISGAGIQNDRDWKESYVNGKEERGEVQPEFAFPVNRSIHRSLLHSWRLFIKEPTLLYRISTLNVPSLFILGENDIRPSWPIEQLTKLIKSARLEVIETASHYIWLDDTEDLKESLQAFIQKTPSNHKMGQ